MEQSEKRRVINKWVEDNYDQLWQNIVVKLCTTKSPFGPELFQVSIQQFLEKDTELLYRIITTEKPEHYLTRLAALNLKSKSSHFYTKYRKPTLDIREFHVNYRYKNMDHDYEIEEHIEDDLFAEPVPQNVKTVRKTMKALKQHNMYYHDIIDKLYVQGWPHDEYADYYQIPMNELRHNVTTARNWFRRIYKTIELNGDYKQ